MKKTKRRKKARSNQARAPEHKKPINTSSYPENPPIELYQAEADLVPCDRFGIDALSKTPKQATRSKPSDEPFVVAGFEIEPLARPEQVMRLLKISRRTLQRLIAAKQIPGLVKVGSQNRFIVREIEAWITHQSVSHRLE